MAVAYLAHVQAHERRVDRGVVEVLDRQDLGPQHPQVEADRDRDQHERRSAVPVDTTEPAPGRRDHAHPARRRASSPGPKCSAATASAPSRSNHAKLGYALYRKVTVCSPGATLTPRLTGAIIPGRTPTPS